MLLPAAGLCQCGFCGPVHRVERLALTGKAHLGFCGVHIHVHQFTGHVQHEHASREFALHQGAPVCVFQRRHHGAVFYKPPVDKKELHPPACPAGPGRGDQAVHPVRARRLIQLQKILGKFAPQHRIDRAAQAPVAGGLVLKLPVLYKAHRHFRVREGHTAHRFAHKRALAGVLF